MVTETVQKERMEIARMRFGMIAPVIQDTYPDPSVSAYCRRVSQSGWPGGTVPGKDTGKMGVALSERRDGCAASKDQV